MEARSIQILTIFPEIFSSFLATSLIAKAQEKNLVKIEAINIRDFADPPHFSVDDTPYGGGAGMVMKPEPLARAIRHTKQKAPSAKVILLTPAGKRFSQADAHELSGHGDLILVCGRYEGVDQRVIDLYVDSLISIGDFVLMGGEIPAMAIIEASLRLIDDVIGNKESLSEESFSIKESQPLLEAPHYTKPAEFEGEKVPEVLLSGNHKEIAKWRKSEAHRVTREIRPDLLGKEP
jgi:tRNA (guanine37-N1)-methyltransferase